MDMPSDNEENQSLAEWKMQRRKEFRENIDLNHDGKVTREELLVSSMFFNLILQNGKKN